MVSVDPKIAEAIIKKQYRRERKELSKFACRSVNARRRFPNMEKIPDHANVRPAFSHDADSIMHSLAYSRYIDKTQVFYLIENDHITHRVLHVQMVSKIARSIGGLLDLNQDLIEAIALAHDVGHAPYGHNGERYLQGFCGAHGIGTFAHNAQSVRLLMELEEYTKGLNLTIQVLDGVLCHNGEMLTPEYRPVPRKTWADFLSEYGNCLKDLEASKKILPMTLEACVVRISDVIAYIGRDIEDAIKLKLIKRTDLPRSVTRVLGSRNSPIINTLASDLLNNSYGNDRLQFSDDVFAALDSLLKSNNKMIYANPKKTRQDDKIERMFEAVLCNHLKSLEKGDVGSAIHKWASCLKNGYIDKTPKARIVVDYVSGMTDDYLNKTYTEMVMPKSFGFTF